MSTHLGAVVDPSTLSIDLADALHEYEDDIIDSCQRLHETGEEQFFLILCYGTDRQAFAINGVSLARQWVERLRTSLPSSPVANSPVAPELIRMFEHAIENPRHGFVFVAVLAFATHQLRCFHIASNTAA